MMPKRYRDIAGDGGSNIIGQVQEQRERLRASLAGVKRKVAVMSGKGGVGKSFLTVNLSAALALKGLSAGILDADVNGPSTARMLGVEGQKLQLAKGAVSPAVGPLGIRVMSMDLLLEGEAAPVVWDAPTQQDPFIWQGTMEVSAIRELLADTDWGELDCLMIDLPPGSERLSGLAGLLPNISGALVVTIPSLVSVTTVKRSVNFAKEVIGTPIIGLVENMKGYACPRCGERLELFRRDGGERQAGLMGIPYLGEIPFDPLISSSADEGKPFVLDHGASTAGRSIISIAEKMIALLEA